MIQSFLLLYPQSAKRRPVRVRYRQFSRPLSANSSSNRKRHGILTTSSLSPAGRPTTHALSPLDFVPGPPYRSS
jgi:hypothetical protein